ncbi:MAG: hypothetical protein AAF217_12385 [Pseudomonadota bacterium]
MNRIIRKFFARWGRAINQRSVLGYALVYYLTLTLGAASHESNETSLIGKIEHELEHHMTDILAVVIVIIFLIIALFHQQLFTVDYRNSKLRKTDDVTGEKSDRDTGD